MCFDPSEHPPSLRDCLFSERARLPVPGLAYAVGRHLLPELPGADTAGHITVVMLRLKVQRHYEAPLTRVGRVLDGLGAVGLRTSGNL